LNPADIADEESWTGGYYELALDLGGRDDARLDAALKELWREAGVEGCFYGSVFRGRRLPASCSLESVEKAGAICGVLQLPLGAIVCGGHAVRFDDSTDEGDGNQNDWLCLALPLAALSQLEPRIGGFPFGDQGGTASLSWRRPLDEWLITLARKVHPAVQFERALVGFEVSCESLAEVPADRFEGQLVVRGGELRYYPATK
jgi:hypothetical protein